MISLILSFISFQVRAKVVTKKVQVDLSSVPNLGSSQTEAGVNLPGMSSYYYYQPGSAQSKSTASTYKNSSYFATDKNNITMTSLGGIFSLFNLAQTVGQRLQPNAVGSPMFVGECKDCQTAKISEVSYPSSDSASSEVSDGSNPYHNSRAIHDFINAEITKPFVGMNKKDQEYYTDEIINLLDPFGGQVLSNTPEYVSMCANFENLNPDQRKAFMVFMYSEVFKQTTNYNNSVKTQVNGGSSYKVGMCELEYNEMKTVFKYYNANFSYDDQNKFNSEMISDPYKHINSCVAKMYYLTENQAAVPGGFQKTFPSVDFNKVKANLQNLNMCKKGRAI